jgi:hypothetical protein
MRWHGQWMEGGMTIERFYGFIDHIHDNLDQNHPGRLFVFTMDNLSAHIEYVFNAIQSKLRIYSNRLETMDNLSNRINLTVGGIFSFHQYVEHMGSPVPIDTVININVSTVHSDE